ncbi:hypothetical protein BU23DRAFT_632777 [Bimuria novae-zelandiae CBS 107.79]|uniref:Uncharacterized protein n=1 Tax=Bimuria novae-zelandiae CBS 107.79 TaxID=1447943 RepID=A0A6A5VGP6_9PLEO|nr:hypothetical protein BU23DRAFT_632777 [Bimuria novae-zelandiae CBS 107.79]
MRFTAIIVAYETAALAAPVAKPGSQYFSIETYSPSDKLDAIAYPESYKREDAAIAYPGSYKWDAEVAYPESYKRDAEVAYSESYKREANGNEAPYLESY